VLQEFYVAVTRKLADPLPSEVAENVVRNLTELPMIQIDSTLVLSAIGKSRLLGFSFWDSLIIAAALYGGAECLFTEDLQHGQIVDGMRIENPFI
jgi:predicted nucleic acid-binding protein